MGLKGRGPTRVITDLGILEPDPLTGELILTAVHPNTSVDEAVAATGWPLRVSATVSVSAPPTEAELRELRLLTGA
jgi:acyl CoA:acetate/3-ketoacid CoA transferase beta subunit